MIENNLSTLQIHTLTQKQYNKLVENDELIPNALYLTPDVPSSSSTMIVLIKEDGVTTNYTVAEIYDYVTSGGNVILIQNNEAIYQLDYIDIHSNEAIFTSTEGNFDSYYQIAININKATKEQITYGGAAARAEQANWSTTDSTASSYIKNKPAIFKGTGNNAIREGSASEASAADAHAEGQLTVASGVQSHAEGGETKATHPCAHAEGHGSEARNEATHAEGRYTKAIGMHSHTEGEYTEAKGLNSHAEGYLTVASGVQSHAEGKSTSAFGDNSHAEGESTTAYESSHAEGYATDAIGKYSHTEGYNTVAGLKSHAEGAGAGWITIRLTGSANAKSYTYIAERAPSISIGDIIRTSAYNQNANMDAYAIVTDIDHDNKRIAVNSTLSKSDLDSAGVAFLFKHNGFAWGTGSHSEGSSTAAGGEGAHSEGYHTRAYGKAQHVQGQFNALVEDAAHIVGNGSAEDNPSNAHVLDWDGNAHYAGNVYVNSNDAACTGGDIVATQNELNGKLSLEGGQLEGSLTTQGIILTQGHDYGDATPTEMTQQGRLYFVEDNSFYDIKSFATSSAMSIQAARIISINDFPILLQLIYTNTAITAGTTLFTIPKAKFKLNIPSVWNIQSKNKLSISQTTDGTITIATAEAQTQTSGNAPNVYNFPLY